MPSSSAASPRKKRGLGMLSPRVVEGAMAGADRHRHYTFTVRLAGVLALEGEAFALLYPWFDVPAQPGVIRRGSGGSAYEYMLYCSSLFTGC